MDIDLSESREGFCRRGRGRSYQVEGPKTKKAQDPTVKSLVRGISGGCEYQKQNGEYGRVCKVEDSHRDKTAHARDTFIADCWTGS